MTSGPEIFNDPEVFAAINTDNFDLSGDNTLLGKLFSDIPTLVDYDFMNNIINNVAEPINIPCDTVADLATMSATTIDDGIISIDPKFEKDKKAK